MNKYQEERKEVFKNIAFSSDRKEAVLDTMNHKKKVLWQPIAAFVTVACIALFFLLINKEESSLNKSAADRSTLEGYFESIFNSDNDQDEKMTLLYQQKNIFQENDALIISTYPTGRTTYYIHYLINENDEWHMKGSTSLFYEKDEYTRNFNILEFENNYIFVGGLGDDLSNTQVYVGKKEAIILNDKSIHPFWLQKGGSSGTPIFYKSGNNVVRVMQFDFSLGRTTLPMIEAVGDYAIYQDKSYAMHGIEGDYMEFPLAIDRAYYNEKSPSLGDVVLIEKDGVQKLVRIKGIGPSEITVKEGSILIDGKFIDMNYMIASENGNIHVDYSNMLEQKYILNENQYFVQSDNWASEDFYEGIVMKEDIIGKVIGYSLLDIEPNWTDEEINLYEEYKKDLNDRLLVNIDPQTIYRLQKYAITHDDYRTAYALYDEDSLTTSYKKWAESESAVNTKLASMRKRHIYDAYLIQEAVESENGNETIFTKINTSRIVATFVYKNGIYKVKYEQVTDLTLN